MTDLFCLPLLPTYLSRTPDMRSFLFNMFHTVVSITVVRSRTSRSFSRDGNGKALEVVVFPPLN